MCCSVCMQQCGKNSFTGTLQNSVTYASQLKASQINFHQMQLFTQSSASLNWAPPVKTEKQFLSLVLASERQAPPPQKFPATLTLFSLHSLVETLAISSVPQTFSLKCTLHFGARYQIDQTSSYFCQQACFVPKTVPYSTDLLQPAIVTLGSP